MNSFPTWLPNLGSWLSALALTILMWASSALTGHLWHWVTWLINFSPKLGYLAVALILLLPIAVIAIAHHWLHRSLDQFYPETRSPAVGPTTGWIPGLMSWWEGLYGWWVSLLSTTIATLVIGIILTPFTTASDFWPWLLQSWNSWATTIARIFLAALLYQFEYTVRRHLITTTR
jgi:hypothetical protein